MKNFTYLMFLLGCLVILGCAFSGCTSKPVKKEPKNLFHNQRI